MCANALSHSPHSAQLLVAGSDAVIHLALSAGWDQMRTRAQLTALLKTSELGTHNVLEAAKAAGNIRVVFVSSIAVCAVTM